MGHHHTGWSWIWWVIIIGLFIWLLWYCNDGCGRHGYGGGGFGWY